MNAARHLVAVHVGHTQVEHDDTGVKAVDRAQRAAPVVHHLNASAEHLQQQAHAVRGITVVIHHEDAGQGQAGRRLGLFRRRNAALAERQAHRELASAAGTVARRDHAPAVQLDQIAHQREADAQPALRMPSARMALRKHVENVRQRIGRDSGAIVVHRDHHVLTFAARAQRDAAARCGVLGGIVEQVGEDLREAHHVRLQHDRLRGKRHRELVLRGVDQRPARLERGVDHRCEIDRLLTQLDLAQRDSGHFHQVVDQPRHVADLPIHHLQDTRPALAELRQPQHADRVADRRERIAQLMREHREERVLAPVGFLALLQVRAHLVLTLARAQRGEHSAIERRKTHRALEQRNVSERSQRARYSRGIGALAREHEHRNVGPGWLARNEIRGSHIELGHRLLGEEQRRGAALELACQSLEARASHAIDAILAQRGFDQLGIPADGGEDQQSALQAPAERRIAHARVLFSGTPVSTPR